MKERNILYLFDDSAPLRKKIFFLLERFKPERLIFVPLTINEEHKSSIIQKICNAYPTLKTEVLIFSELFNKKAFSTRNTHLKFISSFADLKISSKKNIKEYFKFPFKKFSVWWLSLVAEKSTLKSNSYSRLAKFLAILDIQKRYSSRQIWLDISDRTLASLLMKQSKISKTKIFNLRHYSLKAKCSFFLPIWCIIRGFIYFVRFLLKIIYTKKAMRNIRNRKNTFQKSDFLLVTYFPVIDKEEMKKGKFIDKFYEPLQAVLERNKKKFSWLLFHIDSTVIDSTGYSFKESVNLGRFIDKSGHHFFFCEEWFKPRDIFIVLGSYIYIMLKFLLKKSRIVHNFKYPYIDTILWPIYRYEWFTSFMGSHLMHGLIYYRIFKNAFCELKQNSTVLYIAEMYAWEKALNIAAQEVGGLRTVGIQHTIVPLLMLNYFNDRNELNFGDNVQGIPMPNYLGCVGRIPAQIFRDMGWPEEKIFLLGAMRFHYLRRRFEHQIKWQNRNNVVVVALAMMPLESKELLRYAYFAFRNQWNYKVLIKSHPACNIKEVVDSLDIDLGKDIFHITDRSLNDILASAKVTVVTESSSALVAIAYECPVVIPRLVDTIDMSPLTGISNLGIYVNDPVDLRKTVNSIMKSKDNPIASEKYQGLIDDYFDLLDSNENFLSRLESLK